jgi:peptide/nickel transport system permease protein
MLGLIGRRLLSLIPLLLIVSFVVFALVHLIPGDAATTLAGGIDSSPERIQQIRTELRLDEPFVEQYKDWLTSAVQGDFGNSFQSGRPVSEEIARALPYTVSLIIAAAILGLLMGVPIGILAGMRAGTRADRALIGGATLGLAIPSFWLASVLILVFAVNWHLLPALSLPKFSDDPDEWLRHAILPSFALSLGLAAAVARQLRAAIAEAMESNYIRTLWASGARKSAIAKHVLKNAAIPAVTVFGFYLGALLGGAVIVERIFSIPGLGSYVLNGVTARDIPVIQGVAILFVVIYVVISLILDISYGYLNPKVRVT